ncbi:helix-hairpin-helix domain-containing protein [Lachnospiraceae bacterium 66-29]
MKKVKNLICILVLAIGISGCANQREEAKELLLSKETAEVKAGSNGKEEVWLEAEAKSQKEEETDIIYVQVSGAVNHPGVYELPLGSRVFQALELAGGMTQEAQEKSINQAQTLEDGQMIWVPTVEEAAALPKQQPESLAKDDGKVNLNTATKEELQTLPGIGEAKAQSIVAWREEHGSFTQIEDIMKIEGIKEGVFSKIKDSVKVQ